MEPQVYINGKFFPKSEAKVSVFDHGLLYGDGVFEGIRCYSGRVFKLKEHVDRLFDSARAIGLTIETAASMTKAQMTAAVEETCRHNQMKDGYVRLVVTRGGGHLGLDPTKSTNPQVIIIADKINLYPEKYHTEGLAIVTAATMRMHPSMLSPRIKSLNYLNNILARLEGKIVNCEETLMLNHKGEVAECTGDNIFIIRDGKVETPPPEAGILEGITRGVVMEICQTKGIPCRENVMTRFDIYRADECFLTGTAAEIIPVISLDARLIGAGKPGPYTAKLRQYFRDYIESAK